jgi:hypothetical protein
MKISDLNGKRMPHLYLDLDGVQADFFGAWAKIHDKAHYKDIGDRSEREQSIIELSDRGPAFIEKFFATLPPLPGGQKIIQWLKQNHIPYTALSAPLRGNEDASIRGKRVWLDQHHPGSSPTAIFTGNKDQYAVTSQPNVLVDDFGKYVELWKEAGGIGVKHSDQDTDETLATLKKIYAPYL